MYCEHMQSICARYTYRRRDLVDLLDHGEGRDHAGIGLAYAQYISTVVIPCVGQRRLVQEYAGIELAYAEHGLG